MYHANQYSYQPITTNNQSDNILNLSTNGIVVRTGVNTYTVTKVTLTSPATGSTITIIDGKTLTVNNTISFSAADDTGVYTLPTGTASLAPLVNPSFTTPNLGTPSAGTLTNCTGLPEAGISGSAWTVFTPSFGGFSISPTVVARYKVIGKICFITMIATGLGTSNANTFTINGLPKTSVNTGVQQVINAATLIDNGNPAYGQFGAIANNSTTLTLYLNNNSSGFTTSGSKSSNLSFFYETV